MYKVFSDNGTAKINMIVSINGSNYKPITECDASTNVFEVIKRLPGISMQNNMMFTEHQINKLSNTFGCFTVQRDEYGKIWVSPNHKLLTPALIKSTGITHRSLLSNGFVTNYDSLTGINVPAMKSGKRLSLVGGMYTIATVPDTDSISIGILPDGIACFSEAYAAKWQIMTRDGNFVPLQNGDKVVDIVGGYLIKATARIVKDMDHDIVLGPDAIKAENCTCPANLHIQLRCEERVTFNSSLTYESWCWMPDLLKSRIEKDLTSPYRYRVIVDGLDSESYQPASYDHSHTNDVFKFKPVLHTITKEVATLKDFFQMVAPKEAYASLFMWTTPDGVLMTGKEYDTVMLNGVTTVANRLAIQDRMVNMVRDLISHSVNGAWSVANWLKDDTTHISLPYNVWVRLGKPSIVAVGRSPFIELIKFNVITHNDGSDFRVDPKVMTMLGGDLDGDTINVIADADVVSRSLTYAQAMNVHEKMMKKASDSFKWIKEKHGDYVLGAYNKHCAEFGIPVAATESDINAKYYQHYLAFKCQMVPQASVIVSNMISFGKLDHNKFLMCFRVLKQASLDQQDGGFPMFNYLMGQFFTRGKDKSYLSRILEIDDNVLAQFIKASNPFIVTRTKLCRAVAKGFRPDDIDKVWKYTKYPNPFSKLLEGFKSLLEPPTTAPDDGAITLDPVSSTYQPPDMEFDTMMNMPDDQYNASLGIDTTQSLGIKDAVQSYKTKVEDAGLKDYATAIDAQCNAASVVKFGNGITSPIQPDDNVSGHWVTDANGVKGTIDFFDQLNTNNANKNPYRIYTDGSMSSDGIITWAFAVINDVGIVHEASGVVPMHTYDESRNVAGEVYAVCQALDWADKNHHVNVAIYHDYNGISKWATGEWRALKPISKYLQHQLSLHEHLNITWVKVDAHSGDVGNELVDALCTSASENHRLAKLAQ